MNTWTNVKGARCISASILQRRRRQFSGHWKRGMRIGFSNSVASSCTFTESRFICTEDVCTRKNGHHSTDINAYRWREGDCVLKKNVAGSNHFLAFSFVLSKRQTRILEPHKVVLTENRFAVFGRLERLLFRLWSSNVVSSTSFSS